MFRSPTPLDRIPLACPERRLLALLAPAVPSDWQVLGLADRGRYAPWLFRSIVSLGWHPGLRINRCTPLRPLPWPTTFPASTRSSSRLNRLAQQKT